MRSRGRVAVVGWRCTSGVRRSIRRWCVHLAVSVVAVVAWRVLVEGETVAPANGAGVGGSECADEFAAAVVGACVMRAVIRSFVVSPMERGATGPLGWVGAG